jgi:hypothetical protein
MNMESNTKNAVCVLVVAGFLAAQVTEAATLTVTSTADNGPGTLRAALASAADGDTIDATGISGTIVLTSGELLVTKSLVIAGPGPDTLALDGNAAGRVLYLGSNTVVGIRGLTIANGAFSPGELAPWGAGIWNDHATLTLSNCAVRGNSAVYGGGIYNDAEGGSAALWILNSTLTDNLALAAGGILNDGEQGNAMLTLVDSSFGGNQSHSGSGVYNDGEEGSVTLAVTNCTVSDSPGTAIYNDARLLGSATATLFRSTFVGAGIYNLSGNGTATVAVLASTVNGSPAPGIFNDARDGGAALVTVASSTISSNSAGGIVNGGTLKVLNSLITRNSSDSGGAIANWNGIGGPGGASVEIVGSILSSNTADYGGAIDNVDDDWDFSATRAVRVEVIDSLLLGNSAHIGGGGIFNNAPSGGKTSVTLLRSTLADNSAGTDGGAVYNSGLLDVVQSTLSGNSASAGRGGGVFNSGPPAAGSAMVTVLNSTFSGNSAPAGGGIANGGPFVGNPVSLVGTGAVVLGGTLLNAGALGANLVVITNIDPGGTSGGTISSLGHNLSSDDGGGFLTAQGDLLNSDPLLGPLQDNGGLTPTHALLCGSPAIDVGTNFTRAASDQRGATFARTFDDLFVPNTVGGDGTDIGAFEVQKSCLSPAQALERLLVLVNATTARPQPLRASLEAAQASVARNNLTAAINQLQAFQNKVRAQVAPYDPALAAVLLRGAQDIIGALTGTGAGDGG